VGNASWGRGMRHAVGGWFVTKPPMQLAYQVPPTFPTCPLPLPPLNERHFYSYQTMICSPTGALPGCLAYEKVCQRPRPCWCR
jgi:hypothetical protein